MTVARDEGTRQPDPLAELRTPRHRSRGERHTWQCGSCTPVWARTWCCSSLRPSCTSSFQDGAARSREHDAGNLDDSARALPRGNDSHRQRDEPARVPRRPVPRAPRAVHLALVEPAHARRPASDRRGERRASGFLAGAQAPWLRPRRCALCVRVSPLSGDTVQRVHDHEQLSLGRDRRPARSVRDLVSRRGPPDSLRPLRAARGHDERGDPARRSAVSASGTPSGKASGCSG